MRPLLFDSWAILAFIFWMGFCWLLCVRRVFWGNVTKNILTSLFFAIVGIGLIYLATRPWINTVHIPHGTNLPPPRYNSEILNLVGSMCLVLSLSIRVVLQPNPFSDPRILVSDEHEWPLSGTNHIIDEVKTRVNDIVVLTAQRHAVYNGPWRVTPKKWIRPYNHKNGLHAFGSWIVANCGSKFAHTLWWCVLSRNDIIGEGELDWKQVERATQLRSFGGIDVPATVGEAAKFLLKVGVLPYQVLGATKEEVNAGLRLHGNISPTASGILMSKTDVARDSKEWGPRVKAAMRLLIHSGEFEYARDVYDTAVLNGFEHRMTEAKVRADHSERIRNEVVQPETPTRFEREEVI